jgi:toxin CptA
MTVLVLSMEGRWSVRGVLITPDSIDAEEFRQLRVWLKWRCRLDADSSAGV